MNDERNSNGKEDNLGLTFVWIAVGLAPIPMLLFVLGSPHPILVEPLLIVGPLCNLIGGIGCLRGIENVAVRIILGFCLAAFFFGLSLFVAVFEACSHMN